MLGAIIGDIVGSRYEFNSTNNYNFEMFGPDSGFTDDTVCTIAIADALLKGRDFGQSLHDWCRRYPNPKGGYGGRFARWVRSDNPKPYGSFGNGSAMRVSPIGWWTDNVNEILGLSKQSAECTHNHEDGINGAQAIAVAIAECRQMRRKYKGKSFTPNDILMNGLYHGIICSSIEGWPNDFKLNLNDYRNKFDETCRGTVPVAFWIVMHSTSFEDAVRKAVSLGADADTLGAIVGSMAEALWGIPEWMKKKAMTYLPAEMKMVVLQFRERIGRLRNLSKRCQYFKLDNDTYFIKDEDSKAYDIEREWAHDLARSYVNADLIKCQMKSLCAMDHWQKWADDYDLPVSLIGYIFKHTADGGMFMHERVEPFQVFLMEKYSCRKEMAEKKKKAWERLFRKHFH